jgi:peptidoglycan/xylan/chitin deacetylase (PgdA/CDA1 family)
MFYFVKTPRWLRKIYGSYVWRIPVNERIVYLTFDDGPHPQATPFILGLLKQYNASGTFFCIGKNVVAHPELYQQIIEAGHAVGNHTYNHLNGWKTKTNIYMKDIALAAQHIDSNLFRPPYGRITSFQAKNLKAVLKGKQPKVIMWDVLSGDFDMDITNDRCLSNVVLSVVPGSIVVFHDSQKALHKLQYVLPRVLEYFSQKGYSFSAID